MTVETLFGWACALVIGYSINQGGTCAVAAARDLVRRRRVDKFAGLAAATGAAGLVCLPAAWVLGMDAHLGGSAAVAPTLILGGILLGLGVVLNDACLLGSLWRLGNGELRMLALPVGLAMGFGLAGLVPGGLMSAVTPSALGTPGLPGLAVVSGSGIVFLLALLILQRLHRPRDGRWPLALAMTLLGVTGALLFVVQPGWTYADAVRRGISPMAAMIATGWGGAIAALLTVAGAAISAMRLGVFRPSLPDLKAVARTLGGGVLIALGATMIPGGNDSLLLAAVPAGSVSGAIAFTVMTAVVLAMVALLEGMVARRNSSNAV